jgi:16S rRNA (cytosine967-C5)-methyltransferase
VTPAPLSQQLSQAARCVQAVEAGRSLSDVLPQVPAALRPGVQALAFHALRQLGLARALLQRLTEHAPAPAVSALLEVALSLLAARDVPAAPRYEAFTVVDQAVDAAHTIGRRQVALVNACLRRFLREQDTLVPEVQAADWEARHNHPAWWVKRVRRDHPQHWQSLLASSQQPASLVLRVNSLRMERALFLEHLAQAGVAAQPMPLPWSPTEPGLGTQADASEAVWLAQHTAVEALPGYAQGWFAVQDAAAQVAAPLLLAGWGLDASRPDGASRPLRVLDACAAPGGKTAHVLALAQRLGVSVDLLALEIDAQRTQRIHDNLTRLGCMDLPRPPQVKVADAARPDRWWDGQPFDAILLDAPCTASGIVRRHPDVRWLRREADVAALAQTQQQLLDTLWPLLRAGGRMVYATCSAFKAEGATQVAAFQQRHSDAVAVPAPGHLFPSRRGDALAMADNPGCEHDGFFYARWDKAAP